MRVWNRAVTLIATALLLSPAARASATSDSLPGPRQLTITPTNSWMVADAILDEGAWWTALKIDLPYEISPGDNAPAPVRTEFLATYDDRNFYAAWRCYDPDPSQIRAHYMDRDASALSYDDNVYLMIDPFNDERRAFEFRVNALGVQGDALYTESDGSDDSFDMIWTSAARRTADGYIVEIAIPFDQIRAQRATENRVWGFAVERSYPRSVRHNLSAGPRDRDRSCILCQVDKVAGFRQLEPGSTLEVDPTLTASRGDESNDAGRLVEGSHAVDAGASGRWGLTPNLILGAAVNPDFSQIEADAKQLNIDPHFALYYSEKRPFFLEGADLFTTPIEAVYTRSVADPDWGIKLAGKEGGNAIGVFVAQDTINNFVIPSNQGSDDESVDENLISSVVRYRHDVGRRSSVGVLLTDREGNPYHNRLGAADAVLAIRKSDDITAQFLASDTRYPGDFDGFSTPGRTTGSGTAWTLGYHLYTRSWRGSFGYEDMGRDFRADNGFVPRVDTQRSKAELSRVFHGGHHDWFTRLELGGAYRRITDHSGQLTDEKIELTSSYEGPWQSGIDVGVRRDKEFFEGVLYDNLDRVTVDLSAIPSSTARFYVSSNLGDVVDHHEERKTRRLEVSPELKLRLGRRLDVSVSHDFERLAKGADPPVLANLAQARIIFNFGVRSFVRGTVQYLDERQGNPTAKELFVQGLFSYKLNPRTVLFLGYSDNREDGDEGRLVPTERAFFAKLGYAWAP